MFVYPVEYYKISSRCATLNHNESSEKQFKIYVNAFISFEKRYKLNYSGDKKFRHHRSRWFRFFFENKKYYWRIVHAKKNANPRMVELQIKDERKIHFLSIFVSDYPYSKVNFWAECPIASELKFFRDSYKIEYLLGLKNFLNYVKQKDLYERTLSDFAILMPDNDYNKMKEESVVLYDLKNDVEYNYNQMKIQNQQLLVNYLEEEYQK